MSDAPPSEPPKKPVKKPSTGTAKKKSEAAAKPSDSGFGSVEKIDQQQDVNAALSSDILSDDRRKSNASQPTTARPSISEEVKAASPVKESSAPPTTVSSPPKEKMRRPAITDDDTPINVDPFEDMISREELNNYKTACNSLIQDLQDRLSHEEDAAANLNQNKKKLEGDVANLKKDIENLELTLQKVCQSTCLENSFTNAYYCTTG